MFCRSLFMLVAALSFGYLTSAQATVISASGARLSPSVPRALDYQKLANFYKAPSTALVQNSQLLNPAALPADAFENAASRGLATLIADEKAPSLDELLATARLGGHLYEDASVSGSIAPNNTNGSGVTVRDIAQVLVNRPETGGRDAADGGSGQRGSRGSFSLFNAIMGSQLESEFVETAAQIVTPTVTAEGVVALNFMGLRDFALMVSPVSNQIQVVDFKSGTTLTLSNNNYNSVSQPENFSSDRAPQRRAPQAIQPGMTIYALLATVKRVFSDYVLHPFTLGTLVMFSMIWVFLRLARHAG